MDVKKLTIEDAQKKLEEYKELQKIFNLNDVSKSSNYNDDHWKVGENYFFRLVTHYLVGKLIKVTDKEFVLTNASWIASTGSYSDAMKQGFPKTENSQVEAYPASKEVAIGRGALIDACIYDFSLDLG